jgi:hypothetical protein
LLSNAEKEALLLAEKARLVLLKKNIKQITYKKLDFNNREISRRNNSFHGRKHNILTE